MLKVTFFF